MYVYTSVYPLCMCTPAYKVLYGLWLHLRIYTSLYGMWWHHLKTPYSSWFGSGDSSMPSGRIECTLCLLPQLIASQTRLDHNLAAVSVTQSRGYECFIFFALFLFYAGSHSSKACVLVCVEMWEIELSFPSCSFDCVKAFKPWTSIKSWVQTCCVHVVAIGATIYLSCMSPTALNGNLEIQYILHRGKAVYMAVYLVSNTQKKQTITQWCNNSTQRNSIRFCV